jgi:hypothetical protein
MTAPQTPDPFVEILDRELPAEAVISRKLRDELSQLVTRKGDHAAITGLSGLAEMLGVVARSVVDLELELIKRQTDN